MSLRVITSCFLTQHLTVTCSFQTKRPYRNTDVEICYLPLAHMYERIGQVYNLMCY